MPSEVNPPTIWAALYARVSSDLQSAASMEDQLRVCAEWAAKEGWQVAGSYTDQGISGASLNRPGIQQLFQDADARKFDIILTESLDRLSRDQEDIAHIYKRMRFLGVRIVTLSEGEVNELHIGFKGTMGALYLRTSPTRRGGGSGAGSRRVSRVAATATGTTSSKRSATTASRCAGSAGSTPSRRRSSSASSNTTPGVSRPGRSQSSSIAKAYPARRAKAGVQATHRQLIWGLCIDPAGRRMCFLT
jgi:hypothetical protein